jgi:hypothetical protein
MMTDHSSIYHLRIQNSLETIKKRYDFRPCGRLNPLVAGDRTGVQKSQPFAVEVTGGFSMVLPLILAILPTLLYLIDSR